MKLNETDLKKAAKELLKNQILEKFKDPNLILLVHEEISKNHVLDNDVKLLSFLICCTSFLKNPKNHKSLALKGYRSVGKDSIMENVIKHFPDTLFLTSASSASVEDSIDQYKIIVCSEINLRDEKGANAHLVEKIKQLTEGGTSVIKKRAVGNQWKAEHIKQEQKTILYSTTESAEDEELNTRFVVGSVEANQTKIRQVHEHIFQEFSGKLKKNNLSWIKFGVKNFLKYDDVIFNFLDKLPQDFFDSRDSRSMRDVKRFLSIASGVSWLYQLQRQIDSKNRIIAEPIDLIIAMIVSSKFFNHTYSGLGDQRLQKFIDAMNDYLNQNHSNSLQNYYDETFPRHLIQEKLGVSTNTIKSLVKGCQNLSIIRFHSKRGNDIVYERCQKGVKRVLIGISHNQLINFMVSKKGIKFENNILNLFKKLNFLCENPDSPYIYSEIDTLKLTPLRKNETM